MNIKAALITGTLVLAAICLMGDSALATRVSVKGHNQSQVKSSCGGIFLPKNRPDGTYGCVNNDGSGIICGGKTKAQQRTCDTFRVRGPDRRPLAQRLSR
jgi:hypothetical protein